MDRETQERYEDIEVAIYGESRFYQGINVWHGRQGLDAALIEVTDPSWICPRSGLVKLGRATGRTAGLPFESIGFPRVLRDQDNTRDTEHVHGTLNPGTGLVSMRYSLKVASGVPDRSLDQDDPSPWAGLSGAGLASGELLIGIIIREADGFGDRLTAVPVHALIADIDLRRRLAEAGYSLLVESIELAPLLLRLVPPPQLSPATLLRADLEVVDFRPRPELTPLLTWCSSQKAIDVRVVTGVGGHGKTRLAHELAGRIASLGWVAGFLQADRPGSEIDLTALRGTATSVLLVVDYADTRLRQLGRLLAALEGTSDIAPVRLLLLARSAGDWWRQLQLEYSDMLVMATVTPLDPLDTDHDDRLAAWQAALVALAARLPELDPTTEWQNLPETVVAPPDLLSEKYGSPLSLQVAALTELLQAGPHPIDEPGDRSREDVLLDHEERYWRRSAADRQLGYQPSTLKLAVAAATLLGAATEHVALDTVDRMPPLRGLGYEARLIVARWIADLYPTSPDQYWGTLQPDPLAEHLVDAALQGGGPDLLDSVLPQAAFDQQVQGLRFLARASPRSQVSRAALRKVLTDHREELEDAAVAAAVLASGGADSLMETIADIVAAMSREDRETYVNQLVEEPEGVR